MKNTSDTIVIKFIK